MDNKIYKLISKDFFVFIAQLLEGKNINRLKIKFSTRKLQRANGYAYHPSIKNTPNYSIIISKPLESEPVKMFKVLLHELAHIYTDLEYGREVKGHGKEFFTTYKTLFYKTDKKFFPDLKLWEMLNRCFSLTSNYKQFKLCFTSEYLSQSSNEPTQYLFELPVKSKFKYQNKTYEILKKESMYYKTVNTSTKQIYKFNRFTKVTRL